jgi:hypothetical protein
MTDSLLSTLKTLDPVDIDELRAGGIPPTPSELFTDAQHALHRRRRRVPIRLVAAAGVAAVLLIAAGLLPSLSGTSPAQRALDSVAAVAAAQSAPAPAGFAYVKLRSSTLVTVASGPGYSYLVPETIEQWTAPDGSGRVRTTSGRPMFVGPRDEQRWHAAGTPHLGTKPATSDKRFGAGELTATTPGAEGLPPTRDLPTDPGELTDVLHKTAAQSSDVPTDAKTFEIAAAVLMQSGASPKLRAALYQVVAHIDGVTLRQDARDPQGRSTTAVSLDTDYSGAPTRETLYFNASSAQSLAFTSELLEPQRWIDGRSVGSTTVLRSGHVARSSQRP